MKTTEQHEAALLSSTLFVPDVLTFPRDQEPFEELSVFPLQGPGSKLSSRNIVLPPREKGLLQGWYFPKYRNFSDWLNTQHFISTSIFLQSQRSLFSVHCAVKYHHGEEVIRQNLDQQ